MSEGSFGKSVAIFFYAGDFVDVLRRHAAGMEQIYATHDEVARLVLDLRAKEVDVTIYSYVGAVAKDESPMEGVRVISLGTNGNEKGKLKAAVASVTGDTIIAHLPYPELLNASIKSGKRVFVGFANSYNEPGLKQFLRRKRIAHILNNKRIRMITNHCVPATEHLANLGVARHKLIPWDVPHRFEPVDYAPKMLEPKDWYEVAYAGSIAELKGVGDLIRAIAKLKVSGLNLRASFAGLGDIDGMKALATSLGVGDRVDFRGIVANELVFDMFRDADIVAVPSRSAYPEGFPLTLFEGIASRSPIVCTDHPMFRPVLRNGANCAVFKSGDVDGFADAIRRVLTDVDLYRQLSDEAPATREALRGPADWRTLLTKWIIEGEQSPWLADYRLKPA